MKNLLSIILIFIALSLSGQTTTAEVVNFPGSGISIPPGGSLTVSIPFQVRSGEIMLSPDTTSPDYSRLTLQLPPHATAYDWVDSLLVLYDIQVNTPGYQSLQPTTSQAYTDSDGYTYYLPSKYTAGLYLYGKSTEFPSFRYGYYQDIPEHTDINVPEFIGTFADFYIRGNNLHGVESLENSLRIDSGQETITVSAVDDTTALVVLSSAQYGVLTIKGTPVIDANSSTVTADISVIDQSGRRFYLSLVTGEWEFQSGSLSTYGFSGCERVIGRYPSVSATVNGFNVVYDSFSSRVLIYTGSETPIQMTALGVWRDENGSTKIKTLAEGGHVVFRSGTVGVYSYDEKIVE